MISRKQQLSPVVIIILESSPQSDPVSRSLAMYPTLYVGVYTRDTVNTTHLCHQQQWKVTGGEGSVSLFYMIPLLRQLLCVNRLFACQHTILLKTDCFLSCQSFP